MSQPVSGGKKLVYRKIIEDYLENRTFSKSQSVQLQQQAIGLSISAPVSNASPSFREEPHGKDTDHPSASLDASKIFLEDDSAQTAGSIEQLQGFNFDSQVPISVFDAFYAGILQFPEIYRKRKESSNMDISSAPIHRLPLKKRLADARFKGGDSVRKDKCFFYGINGVDKFKDIPTALIMRYYWDCIVLDSPSMASTGSSYTGASLLGVSQRASVSTASASVGATDGEDSHVFLLSDPSVQEWVNWIEDGKLHPSLVPLIHEHHLAIYYDGCLLIEVHDYRHSSTSLTLNGVYMAEVHRILLKPNEATIAQDLKILLDEQYGESQWSDFDYLLMEEKLRNYQLTMTGAAPLCLDPNPKISKLAFFAHRQMTATASMKRKFRADPWIRAQRQAAIMSNIGRNHSTATWAKNRSTTPFKFSSQSDCNVLSAGQTRSLFSRHLQTLQELKNVKKAMDSEPFHGLDTKRAPSSNLPPTTKPIWQIPIQKIYRTVRMERLKVSALNLPPPQATETTSAAQNTASTQTSSSIIPACYSLHIMAGMDGLPEVLLRIGMSCDSSIGGETLRFKLNSPYQIESFIQSFKALIMLQDIHMKCTTDLTNPSCFPLFHSRK